MIKEAFVWKLLLNMHTKEVNRKKPESSFLDESRIYLLLNNKISIKKSG